MPVLQRCHPTKLPSNVHNLSVHHTLPGRVLLIVSGTLRGSEATWTSLADRILLKLRADLMLVLAEPLVRALQHPYDCASCSVRTKDATGRLTAARRGRLYGRVTLCES